MVVRTTRRQGLSPDTRKGFVDHLYHKLVDVGLHHPDFVFRDDEKLQFGEKIDDNLLNAIKRSKVSIPVISENYAASEWCLREIIQIMECVERGEQNVYPVLYKVEPNDVRNMLGKFGDAFRRREHRFDEDVKRKGKEALKKAVARRIFKSEEFASGHEGKLVKELAEIIMREQQHDFPPSLPMDLVGIDDHVTEVMKLVNAIPSETRTIVIYGIGGIGKTTLATIIYKKLFHKFESRSFLKDTRETIKSKGMEHVQSILISDITKSSDYRVRNFERGIGMIRIGCEEKKVLILLDDVDCQDHLDNMIGHCNFKLGSRIIITCRDKALLKSEYESYELKKISYKDSLILFNKYAFNGEQPPRELADLSRDIAATARGLPLALVIAGSLLKGKHIKIWKEMQKKLRKVPNKYVQNMLRVGYDSLGYEEQQMFLDIACFFIGIDKRIVAYLWEDLQFCVAFGLDRMAQLSLIQYDDENELRMHDQLRDLGRFLTYPADKKLWHCRRLWDEEAIVVQRSKMERLKVLNLSGCTRLKNTPNLSTFKSLEMLILKNCSNLEEIHPSIGDVQHLVSLNLNNCKKLQVLPGCLEALEELRHLSLGCCYVLREISFSIGELGELVELDLSCTWIKKFPESIEKLKKLEILRISQCEIKELPSAIGELESLRELDASGCHKLEGQIPVDIGGLSSLRTLRLGRANISLLPENFHQLSTLEHLDLLHCRELQSLPEPPSHLSSLQLTCRSPTLPSLSHLRHLKTLTLHSCMLLESIPALPSCIQKLSVSKCPKLKTLPNLSNLKSLLELELMQCYRLMEFDGLEGLESLRNLDVSANTDSSNLENLKDLELLRDSILQSPDGEADNLHEIRGLGQLKSLEVLNISARKHIKVLDLAKSEYLKRLIVNNCESLVEIHCHHKIEYLEHFDRDGCKSLEKLPDILASHDSRGKKQQKTD
ncbi:hypothetical protein EUGRSUZ_C00271 [Eucalyptus grandis]|uniref:Uncharacterized protein n=2 Tax=Eucalyptus grandis TaxID=71139 RepID=A0ACC3LAQ6_EUCGR|nr:hypothetical protein EUGRSUZ_C00271 [Eucalyptus grandis]